MKKKRHSFSTSPKGFTLIELLIVIVIVGILIGTLLPRLTGTRERAEDLSSKVGGTQILQALESYYTDNGSYPGTVGTGECLDADDLGPTYDLLLDGYLVDMPRLKGNINLGSAACSEAYFYAPLVSSGIANNGYMIVTKMQLSNNANYIMDVLDAGAVFPLTAITTTDDVRAVAPPRADIDAAEPEELIGVLVSN